MQRVDWFSLSFVLQAIFNKTDKPFLLICNEKEEAAYYLNDLEQLIGQNDVLFTQVLTEDLIK
jgi:transcription-repair coupling factor (superfamily II helicase)